MSTEKRIRSDEEQKRDALIHDEAWSKYLESGFASVSCYECGGIIEFEKLSESAYQSKCECGRFDCVVKS